MEQATYPMCAFSGGRIGLRCPVYGSWRRTGSGAGYQVPGARYPGRGRAIGQ